MKKIKMVAIFVIIIFIIYPITSLATVANSNSSGGTGKKDQYGRAATLEDFIKIYNVNFSSGEELEDYLDDNYIDRYYEFTDMGLLDPSVTFSEYRTNTIKPECDNNVYTEGSAEQILENLESAYQAKMAEIASAQFYNSDDKDRMNLGKFQSELYGYYWAYEYSIKKDVDSKDEYTVEDFYDIYEEYKKTKDGSKEQETAIQKLKDCFNALPDNQITDDMTKKFLEAQNQGITNDVEQKPGEDAQVPIITTPEETYEFNVKDWSPDSTTKVKDGSLLKNIGNDIIGTVSMIGSIISVITLIILGIKYMLGSVEERAEYKKTLMPYLIGAIMVFGITNIINFIISVFGNM